MYGRSRDTFTRPSPVLVLQATDGGVRRPGCEASMQLEHPCMEHNFVDWQPCMKNMIVQKTCITRVAASYVATLLPSYLVAMSYLPIVVANVN